MRTSIRRLSLSVGGVLVVGLVLGGLSVEAVSRTKVHRAQRALPGALVRALRAEDLPDETRAALAEARSRDAAGAHARAAAALEAAATEAPTADLHALVATAWLAADDGQRAARHAQLAARLEPGDAAAAARADSMVDLAVLYRLRPATRVGTVVGGVLLLLLLAHLLRTRREARDMQRFLDSVSGRLRFHVDGEPAPTPLRLAQDTASLTADVFLTGRYGMACPRRPRRGPTLHVACSHAGSNQSLRLRPVRGVTESAVRIHLRDETLQRLLAQPGRWRVHARLGPRVVATATADVLPVRAPSNARSRRGALTA